MFLALKEIKKEKVRFTMIILVTALIAYLIYFLSSLAFGLSMLNKTAIDYWKGDGVIMAEAANKSIYASSVDLETFEAMGLTTDNTFNISTTAVFINDDKTIDSLTDVVLMGYELGGDNLVPPIVEGDYPSNENEIIVSNNIKNERDLSIGDTLTIATNGRVFELVGFTEDSNYNTVPVAYVSREMASAAMLIYSTGNEEVDAQSTPTPNMPERVAGKVISKPVDEQLLEDNDLQYVPMDEFIENIPGYFEQLLTFGLMIVSLSVIAAIIIGIFMYILTMQKKPIFGILKVQGYRNSVVIKSVVTQTLFLTALGFLIGFGLTLLTFYFLPLSVPVKISPFIFGAVTAFSLLCSLIGALFSVRAILKIDPLEAI